MDKLLAHQYGGQRHRAFSIFILNCANEVLLQKRAAKKYHAANVWSNTCCSHPQPEEQTLPSAKRRLEEELGFTTDILPMGKLEYKIPVGDSLTEWEVDHLFVGKYNGPVTPDPDEVSTIKWVTLEWLENSLRVNPDDFAPWLKFIFPSLKKHCEGFSIK
jgi:isopentenyl-diphosphate delta-isomerase